MNAIRAVRSRRAEMNVPPSRKAHLFITTDRQDAFRSGEIYITKLAYAEQITISSEQPADARRWSPPSRKRPSSSCRWPS